MIGAFLQRPYPQDLQGYRIWLVPLLVGTYIAVFLGVFQPFGLYESFAYKGWIIAGYGVVTTLVMLLFYGVLLLGFPKWLNEEGWVVWKELVVSLALVLLIGTANFVYATYVHQQPVILGVFLRFISMTALVGLFPLGAGIAWRQSRLLKRHLQAAGQLSIPEGRPEATPALDQAPFTLVDDGGAPVLTLAADDLYYAAAAQNYVELHHTQGKALVRLSLKALEGQLEPYPYFLRTHRSYLVNLHHIQAVDGNAQGYRLQLGALAEQVPVSRSRLAAFQAAFQALAPKDEELPRP